MAIYETSQNVSRQRKTVVVALWQLAERTPSREWGGPGKLRSVHNGAFSTAEIARKLEIEELDCSKRLQYLLENGYVHAYPRPYGGHYRVRLWRLTDVGRELIDSPEFQELVFGELVKLAHMPAQSPNAPRF